MNQVIQARDATIDVEVDNLESLLADLGDLRNNHWTSILAESKKVASALVIHAEKHRPSKRNRYKYNDATNQASTSGTATGQLSAEAEKIIALQKMLSNSCYVILDSAISGLTRRFNAIREINTTSVFRGGSQNAHRS